MSYDIIKSISIKKGQVFISAASSNVYPKTYYNSECTSLTKILAEEGRGGLDKVLFKEFRNGNFQGMSTLYAKALVWQNKRAEGEPKIEDELLLAAFKKEWHEKAPVYAFYQGDAITNVGKRTFRYEYGKKRGKQFKNITQARYALRTFDTPNVAFVSEFEIVEKGKQALLSNIRETFAERHTHQFSHRRMRQFLTMNVRKYRATYGARC